MLSRLNRIPTQNVHKWVHTSAYLRMRKPHFHTATNLLNNKKTVGRQRPTKPKGTSPTEASSLAEDVLLGRYFPKSDLEPMNGIYESFIPEYMWHELKYSVRTALQPKGPMAAFNHTDHLTLSVPNPRTCFFQDHIVQQLGYRIGTDLFIMDPQDFLFVALNSFNGEAATLLPLLSSIDQDSNVLLALRQFNRNQDSDDTDSDVIDRGNPGEAVELFKKGDQHASAGDAADADQNVELSLEDGKLKITSNSKVVEISLDELYDGSSGKDAGETKETNVHKLTKSVLNQVSEKYTQMFKKVLSRNDEKKIIYLRDFGGMQDAFTRIMLKSLIVAVEDLKQKGAQVVIIAGHSQNPESEDDLIPVIPNMKHFSVLPPLETEAQRLQWKAITERDGGRRNGEINSKLLVAVYRQKNVLGLNNGNDTKMFNGIYSMNLANIFQSVWSPSEVDRRVSTAIGHALENNRNHLEIADFLIAHDIVEELSASDNATIKKEDIGISGAKVCGDGSLDLEHLKKSCNEYERKLLSRVVDPSKVQGSFQDVCAPPLTIESLQSLISLPLTHPFYFKRGVLKKNFIPGVLLFGPSGTGKTMLAKAVAKDSGSRMLDIQASDVYDMYVGQGEKNVKAIFSLARKLSPCVVFIDEVDSLMSKRGSDFSSKSHREIINQFMVEWDGLSSDNKGVIVMAATNRPFDLDDAVLRRMPRRILVDLPNEEDRLEILSMLLEDEEHEVSLEGLAKATEHYSGSDLKNLCVTAALRAVQQRVATRMPQDLNMNHFKEALKMVPPSSSEEMDSLVEIRKWDSKFGDGKRQKKTYIGFS